MNKKRFKDWEIEEIDEYWCQCETQFRQSVGCLLQTLEFIDEDLKEMLESGRYDVEYDRKNRKMISFFKRIRKQVDNKVAEFKIDPIDPD